MNKITFIHAADLHLDSPFSGLKDVPDAIFNDIKNSTFRAFDALIETAIAREVDFVLLAGDIFDQETPSLKAQIHLRNAFEQLNSFGILVYVSYGNHDFSQYKNNQLTYPENVYIFHTNEADSFVYHKRGRAMAEITGFSYETRSVKREMIQAYPTKSPSIPFHIGMLHGSLYGNEEHQTYAPFTLQQLQQKQYDYWALGHIHKRQILQAAPPIIYPGNIQGRHRKETGEKGCYYVEMTEAETETEFISLETVQFKTCSLNITDAKTIEHVEIKLNDLLHEAGNKPTLIYISYYMKPMQFGAQSEQLLAELTELMNDLLLQKSPWNYIYQTKLSMAIHDTAEINPMFMNEIKLALKELDVQKGLADLKNNQKGHSFLTFADEEALLKETEKLLIMKLLQKSGEEK